MPYKLKKSNSGWKVCKKTVSKCFSKNPLTKERATSQMAALYANESFEQAVARLLQEYGDTTSSNNSMGATTTTPYIAQPVAPANQKLNPNNPADIKNACEGLNPDDQKHVDDVVRKFKTHPEWNKMKLHAGGDDRKLAKQMIQSSNPPKAASPLSNQPLNKPVNTGTQAPVSPPSTAPSI